MKLLKFLMLFCIGAFVMASNAIGQANPYIQVLPANSGVVSVGASLDLIITVGNTGTGSIAVSKLRPIIQVPASVTFLADAQQTGLASGWTILSNTGSQLRLCNSADVIPGQTNRTIILKVQGVTIAPATTFSGNINFGNGTTCAAGTSVAGDNTADNSATSTVEVIAAAACSITASATAGTIACNGGTTTLTASSAGTANAVQYSINGTTFQASPTFTVSAGSYTVTAREVATPSCIATATAVVIGQPSALSATASSTPVGSAAGTNGTATATATGGTSPYTYAWAPGGQTTITATGLTAGTYTVTVTDANGCTTAASATVAVAVCNLAVSATSGAIACNGGTTTLTATATGGTGAVQYSINGTTFQAGNTFTVPAGTYTVTAREVGNTACTATSTAVVIAQPASLIAASTSTAILCNAGNSTVTVSATGGTAPYTGTGTFTRTAGAYTYTVTDANGCTSTTTGTITQPTALAVTATFAPITVFNGTTTVNVAATGGTAPYTGTGAFVRSAGTFTFTVTDANGCTVSTTITINPFAIAVIADPAVGQIFFTNTSDVLQSANTLLFPPVYKLKVPFYNLNQTNIVPNGTIQVKVNLGSKLNLDPAFTLATAPLSNYFSWTSAVVVDSVIITGTQIAAIPADLDAILVFNVKGKLSCTANVNARIIVVNTQALLTDEDLQNNNAILQYTLPVTVAATQVNVTCNGASNGIINVVASPGSTVVIRNAANAIVSNTGLPPGVYTVTATAIGDAPLSNTCSNTTTVTIVQPLVLNTASSTVINNLCNGGNTGSFTASSIGGTSPYTYVISGPTVNTTGATTGVFTFLLAGTYTITSTDANGCTATTTATVGQPTGTAPDVSLGSDISGTLFATSGISKTIVYNVTEIAGNPAVGDTIRITNPSGFTINFNSSLAAATVGSTTYLLDNSRWKIDNSNPAFTSIILTDPLNASNPGTILCNQRLNVSVTITRNTTNISTFTLSARFRRANGELNLNNNLNSIIFTAE